MSGAELVSKKKNSVSLVPDGGTLALALAARVQLMG